MATLTPAEKTDMRKRVLALVEHGLPPMVRMPVPRYTREQLWYKYSHAEELVEIYGLLSGKIEAFNGKLQPAFKACLMDEAAGKFKSDTIVIGASSGNWATQMGLIAPMFDFKEFYAVIDPSISEGKQNHLKSSGAKIVFAEDGIPAASFAYELLKQNPQYHLIDQYTHRGSIEGHQWTMNHIANEIHKRTRPDPKGRELSFFAAVTGTCSTIMAAKEYLQPQFPSMKIWGVASQSKQEKVPGSRSPETLAELKQIGGFPFETVIDGDLITSVIREKAYQLTAELDRIHFLSVGPTGALLLAGIWDRLYEHVKKYNNLDALKTADGKVRGAMFVVDGPLPYLDDPELSKILNNYI